MSKEERDLAKPIADEIMHKIAYYLRYEMKVWPKEDDLADMNRLVKSIIVQNMLRKSYDEGQKGV